MMPDGRLIQHAVMSAGSGSISSRRATPVLATCFAAKAVSVVDSSSQLSAWRHVGTRSLHRFLRPNSNTTLPSAVVLRAGNPITSR